MPLGVSSGPTIRVCTRDTHKCSDGHLFAWRNVEHLARKGHQQRQQGCLDTPQNIQSGIAEQLAGQGKMDEVCAAFMRHVDMLENVE